MELAALQTITRHFQDDGVRYLIAGGMAVVAHGYGRMTFDIDVVLKLDRDNVLQAFTALARAGYQPRVPITAEQFADRSTRENWMRNKGMVVLNMWSERFRDTPVDLFVNEPFDFETAEAAALRETLPDGTQVLFAGLATLIDMKKTAGRAQDVEDVRHLEMLAHEE
jgi:predicted nucleotidyltransferase